MQAPEPDLKKLAGILSRFKGKKDLIPALQAVQEEYGYVPPQAVTPVAEHLKVFPSQIQGVLSFYSMFYTEPRGKNLVTVCRGTACHVRGGKGVLRVVQNELNLKDGETDKDFLFTLETVACLGACALSPVMVVNGQVFGRLNPRRIQDAIDLYRQEEK
jgi:NADH:ubiquinone oxidoreductase subunit E